jgi:hypothetical protein
MADEDCWHLAAVSLVGAATASVWFLIGQLAEQGGTDYLLRIPQLNRAVEVLLGLGAAAVVGVSARVVLHRRDLLVRGGWWRVYGRLLLAGVLVASGGRIVTAAGTGANIGAGAVLLLGLFPLMYLLERTRFELRSITRRRSAGSSIPARLGGVLTAVEIGLGIMWLWVSTPNG